MSDLEIVESDSAVRIALAALEHAPDGFAAVDADMRVVRWNRAAERLLGWKERDVLGELDPSVPDDVRERHEAVVREMLATPGPSRSSVVERVTASGERIQLSVRGVIDLSGFGGPPSLGAFFSLASDEEVRAAQRTQLSRDLVTAMTAEEVIATVGDATEKLTGARDAIILRACASGAHLHGQHALGFAQELAEETQLDLGTGAGPWVSAVEGRVGTGRLAIAGTELEALFVPMGPEDHAWVLALRFDGTVPLERDLVSVAQGIAAEAFVGLQRVELITDLAGKLEILEATAAVASSAGLDLDETLAQVAEHAARSLSCERAGIYLREPDGSLRLASLFATDLDTDTVEGERTAREALDQGRTVIVQDARTCAFLDGPWHHEEGAVAVMVLPMTVAGRDVGSLVAAHTLAHPRGFTILCQQVGAAVAQQAALAIEHARLYRVEQESVRRLTELDQLKRDYVHGLTHDLKTPLTGLLGFVNTLKRLGDDSTPEDRRRYLEIMERQGHRLVAMVEDVLLSASAEDEHIAPGRRERVDVGVLLAEVIETYDPDRHPRISVTAPDRELVTTGDPDQLHRVLLNVLDNALKYSTGAVAVTVGSDGDAVTVDVTDEGQGVAPEERESVFGRFTVGEAGRVAGSTGIGLFTSRSIARGHGGELGFADPEGERGRVMRLTLPLAEA